MLLRSNSTPIFRSWIPHYRDSPSDFEPHFQIPKTPPSFSRSLSSDSTATRTVSESDLKELYVPKRMPNPTMEDSKDNHNSLDSLNALFFSNSGLDDSGYTTVERNRGLLKLAVDGGTGGRGSGGKIGGGGGGKSDGDDDDDGVSSDCDSNHGNNTTDGYYQKIIEANPGNPLLLSNYAIFLKEVRGDLKKAEEYCGRAILEDPNDGKTLSFYASLIWDIHKNVNRADSYFNRAIKASPNDCNVMASYARFLWAVDDEEEEEQKHEKEEDDDDEDKQDTCDANESPYS